MRSRLRIAAALAAALALPAVSPAFAGIAAVRAPLVRDQTTPVVLEKEGVRVASFRFDRLMRASAGMFKGNQSPSVKLAVTNSAEAPRAFAVAIALFDKDGGLLAAASGDRQKLKPGESGEVMVDLEGVNQNLSRAEWIYLALETHLE